MFSWILIELCLVLLTWNAITAFLEECVAKLVNRVLLLYLVVSYTLERYLLVAARVRRELQGSAHPWQPDLKFSINRF